MTSVDNDYVPEKKRTTNAFYLVFKLVRSSRLFIYLDHRYLCYRSFQNYTYKIMVWDMLNFVWFYKCLSKFAVFWVVSKRQLLLFINTKREVNK